jgi:2,3-diketo-5-methylthio-1-phosphopentane phosphatase
MGRERVQHPIKAILLDIEGTTTSISFVYDVLFPYARKNMAQFLRENIAERGICNEVKSFRQEHSDDLRNGLYPPPLTDETPGELAASIAAYAIWLMDRDRKSTPLKSVQGMIWRSGYDKGEIKGHLYEDVPRAMLRWVHSGIRIYIYSSGSVLAQKLLFGNSVLGDLSEMISGYFDTNIGAKREAGSYRKIAEGVAQNPPEIFFVSDVVEELNAASEAGLQVALIAREGTGSNNRDHAGFLTIQSFDQFLA